MRKYSIEDLQEIALSRGGDCLSRKYMRGDTLYEWECGEGHRWKANFESIKGSPSRKRTWCPYCAGKRIFGRVLERAKRKDYENGGECLSANYKNAHTKLKWKCSKEHIWESSANNIARGKWCPYCAGIKLETNYIKTCRSLAKKRGGKCLSLEFKNAKTKLKWECHFGHRWEALASSIKNGSWCPHCNIYFGEEICRAYLEAILKIKLPRDSNVDFLVGSDFPVKELDGYNKEKKIAFEHHGEQHYKKSNLHVRDGTSRLKDIQKKDKQRKALCKKNNVRLIVIPEVPSLTKLTELPNVIRKEFKRLNININFDSDSLDIDFSKYFKNDLIKELQEIAKSKGGKCLSNSYSGCRSKLKWECQKGHQWSTSPVNVRGGSWCPKCGIKKMADSQRGSLEEMLRVAKSRNGKCLSKKYNNSREKLKWQCEKGHKWFASAENIKGKKYKHIT